MDDARARAAADPAEHADPATRRLVVVATVGTLAFVAAVVIAAALYPGGAWTQRGAVGHSLSANFLCDLMQERALNGQPAALGSVVARVGALAMFAAIASVYLQIARLEEPPGARAWITRRVGLVACLFACAIPLLTSDRSRAAHVLAVVGTFIPALIATIASFAICLRSPRSTPGIKAAALLTLIAGGADGLLYAGVYGAYALKIAIPRDLRALINDLLPLLQRIASVGLVAWVLAVTRQTARGAAQP